MHHTQQSLCCLEALAGMDCLISLISAISGQTSRAQQRPRGAKAATSRIDIQYRPNHAWRPCSCSCMQCWAAEPCSVTSAAGTLFPRKLANSTKSLQAPHVLTWAVIEKSNESTETLTCASKRAASRYLEITVL